MIFLAIQRPYSGFSEEPRGEGDLWQGRGHPHVTQDVPDRTKWPYGEVEWKGGDRQYL